MELMFVTTNRGKFNTAKSILEKYGVSLVQEELDIPEIRSDSVEEIAVDKARKAFEILRKPLIVDDSCFGIECLNGFPGPFSNFALKSIGLKGFLSLVSDNRNCFFKSVVVYTDGKVFKVFDVKEFGAVSETISGNERAEAWSELWRIFIPGGYDRTISDLSDEDREKYYSDFDNIAHYSKLGEWLTSF